MDRHVESRLKKESVIWLVTAGENCRPQAVPVWFLWDGKSFLIYSQHGVKVNHVRSNPYVELHLNEIDDDIVRVSGYATISTRPPAHKTPAYVRKYGSEIKGFGWTSEEFARRYPNVIRIRRLKFQ